MKVYLLYHYDGRDLYDKHDDLLGVYYREEDAVAEVRRIQQQTGGMEPQRRAAGLIR